LRADARYYSSIVPNPENRENFAEDAGWRAENGAGRHSIWGNFPTRAFHRMRKPALAGLNGQSKE
jgi:hypothetical protein